MRAVLTGVPVLPSEEEARRWAEEELSRPIYQESEPGPLQQVMDWIMDFLDSLSGTAGVAPPALAPLIAVLVVAAVVGLAFLLAGPVRARRRVSGSAAVFDDDEGTSADLADAADLAAARGDWREAVIMRFRALVRSLDERAIVTDRPGLTAYEATTEAAARLPDCVRSLEQSGRIFDDVVYGERPASASQHQFLLMAAAEIARATPTKATSSSDAWAVAR